MAGMTRRALLILLIALCASSSAHAQGKWITLYIAGWQSAGLPDGHIDYTAGTVYALAFYTTNTNGTLNDPYGFNGSRCAAIVAKAHSAGAKVIISIGGASDSNIATAVANNQSTLISSIATVVSNCGLDGVDIDWEQSINNANFIGFASAIRSAHPTWVITVPLDPTVVLASLAFGLSSSVTQDNMQTYGLGNYFTTSSYFFPNFGTTNDYVDEYVASWEAAGVPASQIGIGIGFYGNTWTSPVSGVGQTSSGSTVNFEIPYGWSIANGGGMITCYYPPATTMTYAYDPSPALSSNPSHPPQQSSLSKSGGVSPPSGCPSGTVTWATYEDEASVAAKAAYINSKGLGGVIVWTVNEGASDPNTGRNPLLDELKLKLNNGSPAPLTQLGFSRSQVCSPLTTGGCPGNPTNITVSGLSGLGMVDVSWNNDTSGTAFDNASDPGFGIYGHPQHYSIQCSTNGSTFASATCGTCFPACNTYATTTSENYMVRQFAMDLTGLGIVAIRMSITATDSPGGNNGFVGLSVQGATGTYSLVDTYMPFGDSITSNCWGANFNSPSNVNGVETLGAAIHTARPAHYPISSYAGQSGWKTSDALSTATYSPNTNIQQFMADFPAVKYVGVSLGTNDANGGVSSSTYCANMQLIAEQIIAAGKTPIIPTLILSPGLSSTTVNAYNSCLATLESNFPAIIPGPDLHATFLGHSTGDGWFFDSLHPSVTNGYVTGGNCNTTTPNGTPCGCVALQQAWATTLESAIYPLTNTNGPPGAAIGTFVGPVEMPGSTKGNGQ